MRDLVGGSGPSPAFLFGPRCPYRVFERSTCRLDRESFERTAEVVALTGRDVTVDDASLSGAIANSLAEGWLEVGEGLGREVRLILSSTQRPRDR